MKTTCEPASFGSILQSYFCDRLIQQRGASPRTIDSYRDTFKLALNFFEAHHHKPAAEMTLSDLNVVFVCQFLQYLENSRHNCIRSRNARLAAIHSFVHYAILKDPTALPVLQAILAIPAKQFDRILIHPLSRDEIFALLDAPDCATWTGRRDCALLTMLYNTGARVSEIAQIHRGDLQLVSAGRVLLHGKGRKERVLPLWKQTVRLLKHWITEITSDPLAPLFPNRHGMPMTRSGIETRLKAAVRIATANCPSLQTRRVSPHVIRHTTAMHLLQSGVDLTVISLWLGHESPETTHQYVEANLAMKEKALASLQEPKLTASRYRPPQDILAFLDSLRYAK